jgi:hypothetical protein
MASIEFREPERRSGAPIQAAHLLTELMGRPETWACLGQFPTRRSATSFMEGVKKGDATRFSGRFAFTSRSLSDGSAEVFAIWYPSQAGS